MIEKLDRCVRSLVNSATRSQERKSGVYEWSSCWPYVSAHLLVAHALLRHFQPSTGQTSNGLSPASPATAEQQTPKPLLVCFARSAHRWGSRLAGLASTSHSLPMREQYLAPSFVTGYRAGVRPGGSVAQLTGCLRHSVLRITYSVTGCSK